MTKVWPAGNAALMLRAKPAPTVVASTVIFEASACWGAEPPVRAVWMADWTCAASCEPEYEPAERFTVTAPVPFTLIVKASAAVTA